jgi:hypothetical protein
MAAVVAFGVTLLLVVPVVVRGLPAAPVVSSTSPASTLAAFVVLGVLAPVLVLAPALAALLAGVSAPLVRPELPRWRLPGILALAAAIAVAVPTVQSLVSVYDTLNGVVVDRRTVLTLDAWRQTWPLAPTTLFVSVLLAWKVAALALGIPMLSLRDWAEPIEIGARRRMP